MRNLQTQDVFACVRMISQAGIKEKITEVVKNKPDDATAKALGVDLMWTILAAVAESERVERLFYNFIAGPFECTPEEVKQMELTELVEKLKECADVNKWLDFFHVVSNTMTM